MKQFLVSILIFAFSNIYSQDFINIIIVNESNEPIPFVNIKLENGEGLITNENGRFALKASRDIKQLEVSHIAYNPLRLDIHNKIDSIKLTGNEYLLDNITLSPSKIRSILTKAFSKNNYRYKRKYVSIRLFALNDSLYYYTEKAFKAKVDNKKVNSKYYKTLYFNTTNNDSTYINYNIATIIGKNPYKTFKDDEKLNELISASYLDNEFNNYYKIKSETDSTNTTMYINKNDGRLYRFEKRIISFSELSNTKTSSNYVYEFEIAKRNTIIMKSFKYESSTNYNVNTDTTKTHTLFMQDLIINKFQNNDSISFKTLKSLKEYKSNEKIISTELLRFFK